MVKRGKLEIIKDILKIIKEKHNSIKVTPLLRQSNLSSKRFTEYFHELIEKGFIKDIKEKDKRYISLTEKGFKFLEKYEAIIEFIDEFDL